MHDIAVVFKSGDITYFHLSVEDQLRQWFPKLEVAWVAVQCAGNGCELPEDSDVTIREASLAIVLGNTCVDLEQMDALLHVVQEAGPPLTLVVQDQLPQQQLPHAAAAPVHPESVAFLQLSEGASTGSRDPSQEVVGKAAQLLASANKLPVRKSCELPGLLVGITEQQLGKLQAVVCGQVKMLVLRGMGGVGKTTWAMKLFNKLHEADRTALCHFLHMFDRGAEQASEGGKSNILRAQEELLTSMAYAQKVHLENEEQGRRALLQALSGKRVILLLDNMWASQLSDMLPEDLLPALAPGSVIIVTSREAVKFGSRQAVVEVQVDFLTKEQSLELLCLHAYNQPRPVPAEEELLIRLVERCAGLPMALEVVGKHLAQTPRRRRRSLSRLEEELLDAYSCQPSGRLEAHRTMFDELNVSWLALREEERAALLDIVWFLHASQEQVVPGPAASRAERAGGPASAGGSGGQSWDLARWFCGQVEHRRVLDSLLDKSMVLQLTTGQQQQPGVGVHSVVRDFCKLGLQQYATKRLEIDWSTAGEETLADLMQQVEPHGVEGMSLQGWQMDPGACKVVATLEQLRLLWLQQGYLSGAELHLASASLKWLSLGGRCIWGPAPMPVSLAIKMESLVILELKHLPELRQLADCSTCSTLQLLAVTDCSQLNRLDLSGLTSLRQLHLASCGQLATVDGVTALQSLTTLSIVECTLLAPASVRFCGCVQVASETTFHEVVNLLIPRAASAPDVYICHAGEQSLDVVHYILAGLKKSDPELDVFVDEWRLHTGNTAEQHNVAACSTARVGVVIVSKEFVRKKGPMAALDALLWRWHQQQPVRKKGPMAVLDALLWRWHQQQQSQPLHLLPVLYGLTFEELEGVRALYDGQPWCVAGAKPSSEVLDQWAAVLEKLTTITVICQDQFCGDFELVDFVVESAAARLPLRSEQALVVVYSFSGPPPAVPLVGRQQEFDQALRAVREQRYVEIRGPPGEGKSTLAQHLMKSVGKKWSQLPQKGSVQAAFMLELDVADLMDSCSQKAHGSRFKHALAAKLLASVREEATYGQEWEVLLGWTRRQGRVAILFENAELAFLSEAHADDLESVLNSLHALANVHLLVATRVEGPAIKGVTGDAVVQLGQLSEAEGLQVVEVHLGEGWVWGADGGDREAARQLVQLVEGNPLVLSMAADLVHTNKLESWQDVLKRTKETGLAAVRPRVKVDPSGLPKYMTLLSHWLSSVLDKEARQLLAALTVFPGSFTAAGADAVAGCQEAEEMLEVLVCTLLVRKHTVRNISSRYPQQQEERYSMHAVVRDAARPVAEAHTGLLRALVHWMVLHKDGPGQMLLLCEPGGPVPDALQFSHLMGEELLNFGAVAAHLDAVLQLDAHSTLHNMVSNWCRIGSVISKHGHGQTAKHWFQSAASSVGVLLGTEHACTLLCKHLLASTLWQIGELGEARQLKEEVLEVCTRVLGPEHLDTLTSKGNLAFMLGGMGDLGKARQLQEEVLEASARVLAPEHPHTLVTKNNLACTLLDMGELAQARQLGEEVLEARVRVLGPEHPDTLAAKNNLASTLRAMGELGQARQLEEEVLEVWSRVLGPEHPDTLTSKHNLASTLGIMGELGQARQLQEEVLEARTRVLGPEHPGTLTSKANLAGTLRGMGELGKARQLQEEVLEARTQVLGPEHPHTLAAKNNLAGTLKDMGELAEARQLGEEVLEARMQSLGPEHPDTLASKASLASTLLGMGELAQARQLGEEVLEARVRVLGLEHPDTLAAKNNLASTLRDMGELGKARQLQEEVLEARTHVLGPEHPRTLAAKNNMASTLRDIGELAEARQLGEEVLEARVRVLGPEHLDTLASKINLASTLRGMGELGQARQLEEEVLEVSTRVLGPEHPDTLTSKHNLASTLGNMGELGQARQLQEEVLEVSTRVLGPEHPDTLTTKDNLASTLLDMGELREAMRLLRGGGAGGEGAGA